jgi:hypothetical protein
MNRSPEAEAQRKVTQAETLYTKMQSKHRAAEAAYETKIATLRMELTNLQRADNE